MPLSISEYVSQCATKGRVDGRARVVWLCAAVCVLLIMGAVVGAPLLAANGHEFWGRAIYKGFAPICHQQAERSFDLHDLPFAVCARCTGLYAGFALGVLVYPLLRNLGNRETPWRGWLIAAFVPTCVDFALGFFGVWENTHLSRSLTGALFGAVAALYVVPGLIDVSYMSRAKMFGTRAAIG